MPGQDFALMNISSSAAVSSRSNGTKTAVFSDGSYSGTIGGGKVEHLSIPVSHCKWYPSQVIAQVHTPIDSFPC